VPRFDLTSIGEAMWRLSVPTGRRLEDTRTLDVEVAGAESNVCTALARLGRRTGWVSRVPDHSLGSSIVCALRADGVDVSAVRRASHERLGTYFIEYATQPRPIQVIYDRADSAAARMTVEDVDWAYLLDTRVLHLTGITAALGENGRAIVAQALQRARAAGITISFDVNYRAKMWPAETAGATLRPMLAEADVLFCKDADAQRLFGCSGEPQRMMEALQKLTRASAIYCTFGERGAALLHGSAFLFQPALPVQIVDRVGSGDAFAAGALDGWLDADPRAGLQRGIGLAAIALSQFGDRVLSSRAELDAVLTQKSADISR
jgi:2-dehydro-3-deoxygluconokinase